MKAHARAPILIIEDNFETRDVLERVLAIRGYDVVSTRDALDGLDYLQRGGETSGIILDLGLPRMDGIEFNRVLRADPRWASIPVIVYTALPRQRVPGAVGFFRK